MRSLVDDGVLAGERGAYRLVKTPDTVHVPATVQAILAARIDRLPAEDKALLQTAAVVGTDVPVAVLAAVAETSADALAEALARLQAAEFLYETRLFPDAEYTFKHALTHEVAYGSLLQERRRGLHARAVEAIERCYPERLAEHVERLAYHALRGEAWAEGRSLSPSGRDEGDRTLGLPGGGCRLRSGVGRAPAPARESYANGAGHRPPHLEPASPWGQWARLRQGVEHDREAEALAEALGDGRRQGRALGRLSLNTWMAGDPDRALELAQRSLVLATAHDDVPFQALANLRLGMVGQVIGEYRRAADRLRQAVESLQGDRRHERVEANVETFAFTQDRLAWCLTELGEFAEAMARADEAGRVARENDDPRSLIVASRSLGLVSLRRGNLSAAIPPLERAVELCRVTPSPSLFDVSAAHLGYAYALSGRLAEGLALLEEAVADPRATGSRQPSALPGLPRGGASPGRSPGRRARGRPARPRPRPPAEGARQRGVGPAPPRRDRRAGRPS